MTPSDLVHFMNSQYSCEASQHPRRKNPSLALFIRAEAGRDVGALKPQSAGGGSPIAAQGGPQAAYRCSQGRVRGARFVLRSHARRDHQGLQRQVTVHHAMKVLVDTCTFLWTDRFRIPAAEQDRCRGPSGSEQRTLPKRRLCLGDRHQTRCRAPSPARKAGHLCPDDPRSERHCATGHR